AEEIVAVVVIADHQIDGEGEVFQQRLELAIGARFAPIGEVAGDRQKIGIAEIGARMIEGKPRRLVGIVPEMEFARTGEMKVGHMDKLEQRGLAELWKLEAAISSNCHVGVMFY